MRRVSIERTIGCAAILPAAFIGLAGLADGGGPTGWCGVSEFVGWAAVCVAISGLMAAVLMQTRNNGWMRFAAIAIAAVAAVSFAYALYWLGYAPMWAKIAFTSSLQVVGTIVAVGLILFLAFLQWSARRQS